MYQNESPNLFTFAALCLVGLASIGSASDVMANEPLEFAPHTSFSDQSTRIFTVRSLSDLTELARMKSAQPYVPSPPLPAGIANLTYEQARDINFKNDLAIWKSKSEPFWVEGFHRGFVQRDQIELSLVVKQEEYEVPFSTKLFHYGVGVDSSRIPDSTGFAGVKLVGKFPGTDDPQEMLTFLGSSYFRARNHDAVYGSSNRGLAVDIALNKNEEFPVFRKFWIVKPETGDDQVNVLALLESPSVTGAYQFTLAPHKKSTEIDVQSVLFFRKQPEKVGLAPLTSMWMWGDGLGAPPLERRPKVHDSDGLLVYGDGQWTWRALSRQSYPSVSRIDVGELQGFGLLQRDNRFENYNDTNAQYHRRPSIWVTPTSLWPAGSMELLELPGAHEGIDNIGAYWVPAGDVPLNEPIVVNYRLSHFLGDLKHPGRTYLASTKQTKVERAGDHSLIRFSVDFEGPSLADLSAETPIDAQIRTVRGEVVTHKVVPVSKGKWSLIIDVQPTSKEPVEVKAWLVDADRTLSESWLYLCAIKSPIYEFPQVYTRIE